MAVSFLTGKKSRFLEENKNTSKKPYVDVHKRKMPLDTLSAFIQVPPGNTLDVPPPPYVLFGYSDSYYAENTP
jgi:hypothetical protein